MAIGGDAETVTWLTAQVTALATGIAASADAGGYQHPVERTKLGDAVMAMTYLSGGEGRKGTG